MRRNVSSECAWASERVGSVCARARTPARPRVYTPLSQIAYHTQYSMYAPQSHRISYSVFRVAQRMRNGFQGTVSK